MAWTGRDQVPESGPLGAEVEAEEGWRVWYMRVG